MSIAPVTIRNAARYLLVTNGKTLQKKIIGTMAGLVLEMKMSSCHEEKKALSTFAVCDTMIT